MVTEIISNSSNSNSKVKMGRAVLVSCSSSSNSRGRKGGRRRAASRGACRGFLGKQAPGGWSVL